MKGNGVRELKRNGVGNMKGNGVRELKRNGKIEHEKKWCKRT